MSTTDSSVASPQGASKRIAGAGNDRDLRRLVWAGAGLVLAALALFVLMESRTLWKSPGRLPGGSSGVGGVFDQLRHIFPEGWVDARGDSWWSVPNDVAYLAILCAMFALYWSAARRGLKLSAGWAVLGRRPLMVILGFTAAAMVVLWFLSGTFDTDVYSYIWYGRILHQFHANPMVHVPSEYAAYDVHDYWLPVTFWKDLPCVYGPVWMWLAAGIDYIARKLNGDISLYVLGHKALATVMHLANAALVWKIMGTVIPRYWKKAADAPSGPTLTDKQRGLQTAATVLYAWNPLLLIEFAANAHNDAIMLFGVLGAIWLQLKGHWRWAVVALGLASLVKMVALLWLPGYLVLLFWQAGGADEGLRHNLGKRVSAVAQSLGIVAVLWGVGYLPFWEGSATLNAFSANAGPQLFVNSFAEFVQMRLSEWLPGIGAALGWRGLASLSYDQVHEAVAPAIRLVVLGITFAVAAYQTLRVRTFDGLLNAWGWTIFAYLAFGAHWFWPWYVAWFVAMAALNPWGRMTVTMLLFSFFSMAFFVISTVMPPEIDWLVGWRGIVPATVAVAYAVVSTWRSRAGKARKQQVLEPALST